MRKKNVKTEVRHFEINATHAGRRIDNFLTSQLKGIPEAHIYKMMRTGEVRVNSSRIKQDYRLEVGDKVRVPPLYTEELKSNIIPPLSLNKILENSILYEDDGLMVLNKPAGMAVHIGSGIRYGVIEILRNMKSDEVSLELVHRLDKATSGCLLIAKDHSILRKLHHDIKGGYVKKKYVALLNKKFPKKQMDVCLSLRRNGSRSGERLVRVDEDGKLAKTRFFVKKYFPGASLVNVELITGRTHQIRVHAAHLGHPIAGDNKYGDRDFNSRMKEAGLKRLFLHAESIEFTSPKSQRLIKVKAPLASELADFLKQL